MKTQTWKLKLTLLLVSSLTIMSIITISPALPQIAKVFAGVPNSQLLVKLVLTIPALMIALFAPIAGQLIDRFGRLKILWVALVIYAVAGTGGYYLNSIYSILVSRAVLGVAVGMSMTTVITLIADYFEGMERQKFVGLQIAFMSLGGILFIAFGGVLADYGWRYPFLLYLLSIIVLPLSILFLNEPQFQKKSNDKLQSVKVPHVIWMLFMNTMIMWIVFFLIPVQIPFYLKSIGVDKSSMIGMAVAASTAFSAISSFSYSNIKKRLSFLSIFSVGYLLMAIAFVCIALSHSYAMVVVAMMLSGLGMGIMIPNTNMWVMKIVPIQMRGREIGKLTTFWFLGQFLSPIVIFPIVNTLSLSSAFMIAAIFLFVMSLTFVVFQSARFVKFIPQ